MFWLLIVIMVNELVSMVTPQESKDDGDDQQITNIIHQIWQLKKRSQTLSLELKEIFIKCGFLKATDKHHTVMTSKVDKYDTLRKLIMKKFATALEKTIDARKGNKYSEFDAYNNYELIKERIMEQENELHKLRDIKLLDKQYNSIRTKLYRAKNELIKDWELDGYDADDTSQAEKKRKDKSDAVEEKTPESMNAGTS